MDAQCDQPSPLTLGTHTESGLRNTSNDVRDESPDTGRFASGAQEKPSLVEDVTIPANILRVAKQSLDWTPGPDFSSNGPNPSQQFSALEIALEQRHNIELVLYDEPGEEAPKHVRKLLEYGKATQWRKTSLPAVIKDECIGKVGHTRRPTAQADTASRLGPRYSHDGPRDPAAAAPVVTQSGDTVLFRSLNSYMFSKSHSGGTRRPSAAIAPESDYLDEYGGNTTGNTEHLTPDRERKQSFVDLERNASESRKTSVLRRASTVVETVVQAARNGATNLMRRASLLEMYEKAQTRGQQLQRKRWLQLVFEYTVYLIILCFIYFVLVGQPLWNGAVWWLYWVVNEKFTIAGTWSVTIGMALFYAYVPLVILFEKEPPMPDELDRVKSATSKPEVADTALLIPCYKSAQIIGPTLVAALKIFPAKNIFVIANGNSPVPLDNTEEVCRQHGVNHVWSPIGSKIVAQYVGCHAAKRYANALLIDDDCALPANFPIVSDRLNERTKCIGYTIKSVGPGSSKGTMCQQAQDLEYKLSGLQREFAGKIGSATFPHGAISLWNTTFLIATFDTHPGFSVSEDWFFGHAARKLGSRITMCSAIFVETETPSAVLWSSGGARGGFGEMTIFKQRFYRWNFFFVNGMYYNMAYILGSWKLGFWEIGAKLFVFQEVYETLLYLLAPFVLPISLVVRPAFCAYLLAGTLGLYYVNVTIFNEIHLRRRNERIGWVCVYLYYTPYKILLTCINVFSCYYSLFKYAKYFAKRHPKIIEDERAIEVVLRLEELPSSTQGADGQGRRLTVTAVGSRVSTDGQQADRVSLSMAPEGDGQGGGNSHWPLTQLESVNERVV